MLPREPGQMATVLVALAVMEGRPSQRRVGKDTSVPPPATELIAPAKKAAAHAAETWSKSVGGTFNISSQVIFQLLKIG